MNKINYATLLEIVNFILKLFLLGGIIALLAAKKECRPDIKIHGDGVVIYWIE